MPEDLAGEFFGARESRPQYVLAESVAVVGESDTLSVLIRSAFNDAAGDLASATCT
jgi:hypothetical protein